MGMFDTIDIQMHVEGLDEDIRVSGNWQTKSFQPCALDHYIIDGEGRLWIAGIDADQQAWLADHNVIADPRPRRFMQEFTGEIIFYTFDQHSSHWYEYTASILNGMTGEIRGGWRFLDIQTYLRGNVIYIPPSD